MILTKAKKRRLIGVNSVLATLMLMQGLVPMITFAAYEVTQGAWIEGHYEDGEVYGPVWVAGHYERIVVEVPDPAPENDTTDPIDTASGNTHFMEKRLAVSCPGIPMTFNMEYSSLSGERPDSSLGAGWTHSCEWSLCVDTNQVPKIATLYAGLEGAVTFVPANSNGRFLASVRNWSMNESTNGYSVHIPSGRDYEFNTDGRLERIQDKWGNQVTCSYGVNDQLEAMTHSNGQRLLFSNSWNSAQGAWQLDSVAVDGGASLSFSYGADGQFTQLVEQVDANVYTSTYQYADGFLTNRIDGAGFSYVYEYEETDGVLNGKGSHLSVDEYYAHDVDYINSSDTDVTYDARGLDQVYRYARNEDNRLEAKYGPAATGSAAEALGTRYAYNTDGTDRIEETIFDNSTGATWSQWSLYDDRHNVTNYAVSYGSINPVQRFSMEYDSQWQLPISRTEPDGSYNETVYTNGMPLVEKAFYSATQSYDTHYAYLTNGLLRAVTNANQHVTQYTYDSNGYPATTVPELGPIMSNTSSPLGYVMRTEKLTQSGSSTGRAIVYERDAKGRAERIDYADGNYETFSYNALGYVTNQTDRAGRVTERTYAPTKQLTSITRYLNEDGINVPVRVGYDLDEQMNTLSITEPRGRHVESYQMDLQDRVTAVINIEGQVMTFDYTVSDFVDHVERFDGSTIDYWYNNAGEKETTLYTRNGYKTYLYYTYHTDGRLESSSDDASSVEYTYNLLNRLSSSESHVRYEYNANNDYLYDAVGNLTNATVSSGWATITAAFSYDDAERLHSISGDNSGQFVYTYSTVNGLVETITNTDSGITCTYLYDLMDRVSKISQRQLHLPANDNYTYRFISR